jgi:putative flippase GtrA
MVGTLQGWQPDPFGAHELRYFALNGQPTRLVRDAEKWSHHVPSLPSSPARFAPIPFAPSHRTPSWIPDRSYPVAPPAHVMARAVGPGPLAYQPEVGFLAEKPWMPVVDPEAVSSSRRALVRRFIRYGSVSAISTVIGLTVLGILVGGFSFPAIWANVIATALGTVPSFALNRRWVWAAHDGQRSLRRQAIPYAICSFAGLVLSTIAVHVAADTARHSPRFTHTVAVELAAIASYGALWLVQFVLCDRFLSRSTGANPVAEEMIGRSRSEASRLARRPALEPAHA